MELGLPHVRRAELGLLLVNLAEIGLDLLRLLVCEPLGGKSMLISPIPHFTLCCSLASTEQSTLCFIVFLIFLELVKSLLRFLMKDFFFLLFWDTFPNALALHLFR